MSFDQVTVRQNLEIIAYHVSHIEIDWESYSVDLSEEVCILTGEFS